MNTASSLLAQVAQTYSPAVPLTGAMLGTFTAIFVPIMIFTFAVVVVMLVSMWKIFVKAGQPGWAGIIPIYNYVVICRLVGKPSWFVLVLIFAGIIPVIGPLASVAASLYLSYLLAKSFGKDIGFAVGMTLLGFIFYPILAFGDATYSGVPVDPVFPNMKRADATSPVPPTPSTPNTPPAVPMA